MEGTCQLCGQTKKLMKSHVYPKFTIDWVKETSATGRLRTASMINAPQQDGPKRRLFCNDCEQILSVDEKAFAERVFHPMMSSKPGGKLVVDYDRWLLRFIVGLALRILLEPGGKDDSVRRERWKPLLDAIADRWRQFLLDPEAREPHGEHHMFFLGDISEHPPERDIPRHIHWYWDRGLDGTVMYGGDVMVHLYMKLPKIAFFIALQPSSLPSLVGTRVRLRGRIGSPQEMRDADIGTFLLIDRPRQVTALWDGISEKQWKESERRYRKRWEQDGLTSSYWSGHKDVLLQETKNDESPTGSDHNNTE